MGMKPRRKPRRKTTEPWGSQLRAARKELGIPAKELASLLGVTPETFSRWENGRKDVPTMVIRTMTIILAQKRDGHSTTLDLLHALRHPRPALRHIYLA